MHDAYTIRPLATLSVPLLIEEMPELPSVETVAEFQRTDRLAHDAEFGIVKTDRVGLWRRSSGQLYVPAKYTDLQMRI